MSARVRHLSVFWVSKRLLFGLAIAALCWPLAGGAGGSNGVSKSASEHWAFVPPTRPGKPEVENEQWVANPIDRFVLARMEEAGLTPNRPANREQLIRRLYLDLLGMLPSPDEVEAFVEDGHPDAYERLVDQLLASPHFGERWGRHWLDRARYADSDGYEKDRIRPHAYRYRDWVIDAFNDDLPFDRFTVEQLAGDLLPESGTSEKMATGFHRNTLKNREGGVDPEEDRVKIAKDRTATTATVWLGLTLECAECHDHKYDPLSQEEYYEFYSFFNRAEPADIAAPRPDELAEYEAKLAAWEAEKEELEETLADYMDRELPEKLRQWEKNDAETIAVWKRLRPESATSRNGARLEVRPDHSVVATGPDPETDVYELELALPEEVSEPIRGLQLEALPTEEGDSGPGRTDHGNFVLSELEITPKPENPDAEAAPFQPLAIENGRAGYSQEGYPIQEAFDGNPETGWAIGGRENEAHTARFRLAERAEDGSPKSLRLKLSQQYGSQHTLKRLRVSVTTASDPLESPVAPEPIRTILDTQRENRSPSQQEALQAFYRETIDPVAQKLDRKQEELADAKPEPPSTKAMTLARQEDPQKTHIHERGDFLRKGKEVSSGVPDILHPLEARQGEAPDRLDLARWLVSPDNPLTARVTVNRIWRHLFGRAIVTTDDDFGLRSEPPSHPKLLDWLATELRRIGWSRKDLIKTIVMSATYRQSSEVHSDERRKDPNNQWLARQGRYRVEAETLRDIALDAAGLLNPKIGGPSFYPPLPDDIAALGYNNSVQWPESEGAEKYRRGIYIHFQRSVPYPMLKTFDAPDSTTTCTRRAQTNTPLQALTLLNDPVFWECAQTLGLHLTQLEADGLGLAETLQEGFRICLAREPTGRELTRLRQLYDQQHGLLKDRPAKAAEIVGHGTNGHPGPSDSVDTAAWTLVARSLLNLDEFMTRE